MNVNISVGPIAHSFYVCGRYGNHKDDKTIEIENADQLKENMRDQPYKDIFKNIVKFPEVDFSQRKVLLVRYYDSGLKYDLMTFKGFTLEDQTLKINCALAARRSGGGAFVGMSVYYNAIYISVPRGYAYTVDVKKKEYNYHLKGTKESDDLVTQKYRLRDAIKLLGDSIEGLRRVKSKALNEDIAKSEIADLEKSLIETETRIDTIYKAIILKTSGPDLCDLC